MTSIKSSLKQDHPTPISTPLLFCISFSTRNLCIYHLHPVTNTKPFPKDRIHFSIFFQNRNQDNKYRTWASVLHQRTLMHTTLLMNQQQHNDATPRSSPPPLRLEDPIVIIGGGIGGFALFVALEKQGFSNIHLYEKDPSFSYRHQGYGLTIQQASTALRKLDLVDDVMGVDVVSTSHYLFDKSGNIIGCFGRVINHGTENWNFHHQDKVKPAAKMDNSAVSDWNGRAQITQDVQDGAVNKKTKKSKYNLHLSRQCLRRLIFEKINAKHNVYWDKHFRHLEDLQDSSGYSMGRFKITFTDETEAEAKLVIGVDGIYSKIRKHLSDMESNQKVIGVADASETILKESPGRLDVPASMRERDPLRYLDVLVVLGTVNMKRGGLCEERVWQTMNGQARLFVMPFENPDPMKNVCPTMWQFSLRMNDHQKAVQLSKKDPASRKHLRDFLLEMIQDWHQPVPEMFRATDWERDILATPVYDREPLVLERNARIFGLHEARITLVGDALHPMSPFKGQGANQALLDAVSLAEQLKKSTIEVEDDQITETDSGTEKPRESLRKKPKTRNKRNQCVGPAPMIWESLREYEQEATTRSFSKVMDSRTRAEIFHSESYIALDGADSEVLMKRGLTLEFVDLLKRNNVGAWDEQSLDQIIQKFKLQYSVDQLPLPTE